MLFFKDFYEAKPLKINMRISFYHTFRNFESLQSAKTVSRRDSTSTVFSVFIETAKVGLVGLLLWARQVTSVVLRHTQQPAPKPQWRWLSILHWSGSGLRVVFNEQKPGGLFDMTGLHAAVRIDLLVIELGCTIYPTGHNNELLRFSASTKLPCGLFHNY